MPDVTGERLRELRAAEERLRLVAENVDEVILVASSDLSEIEYVNPAYEELYGQSVERLYERPRSFLESVHPEDREAYEADVEAMLTDFEHDDPRSAYEGEYRLQGEEDERPRWIHVSRYPVPEGDEGGVERFVVVIEEVTERREFERAYREVFESVGDGLVVHDPETGEILDANERFCGMNGYGRDDLVGETVDVITADEEGYSYEEASQHIHRAREEGPQLFEWRNERADGSTFPVEVHLAIVEIRGEERVLGSVRDITERKRREREYEQIFDGVSDAITVIDPETGSVVDANEAMCDLVGYDREEILEMGVTGLSVTEEGYTAERGRKVIDRVMGSGEPEEVEWKAETADGEHRWLEVRATPATIGGEPRYLAIQRDVTERRRRERMIRSLHESTDELQNAETVEAVCEATVTAMEEVLDLSLPVCWLRRDGDQPALEPVAASDAAREFSGGPGSLEPGTFEYELYERGESTVYDPSERWDRTSLSHALVVPIGEHGVIGAAEPGVEEFEDVIVDAAHILARHTATALERVERARELRESERRFRLIAERIDEVIFLAEPDFSELFYVNDAYEEIWGEPVDALVDDPRGFADGIDPRDREEFEAEFESMLADIDRGEAEDSYTFEYRVRRPDGAVRWVRAAGYPVQLDGDGDGSGGGGETRFVGIVEDVTERRELERTYRAVFEHVSDGLVVHEPETGEILDVNERYCELTGYSEAELVGGNVRLIVPEDPTDTYDDARARIQAAREEGPQLFEFEGERKGGERFVGEVHLSTVEIRGEERVLASVRDVTERKRRKRELRRLTEEYETIFENAQDALFFVDVERTREGTEFVYRRTNRAHEEQTGFSTEDVVGKTPRELTGEDIGVGIEANYRRCVEKRETITYEEELDLPAGTKVWQTKLSPVAIDGEVTQIVGIARDITERREREETLETFHDATRELVSAGSRREASRTAVTAAEEVLGFPLVSVHLYDEEAGSLQPVAATDTLESVLDFLPSFDPGGNLPWQVFVDGEAVRATDIETASGIYGRGVSDPDVALPLGSHGVMLVGAPDREFDPGTTELARILAATLQAALGHVQGQRELEARESELEAHRERADRLERLNTVIREIEQATVEESSREAIERAVCEHLTTVETYRVAWIAEPDVAGESLVVRTSDGEESGYAESLSVDIGSGVSDHPSAAAFETGEVRTVRSLATSTALGEWRKAALRAGLQSMVAVPLAGEGTVHGVLTIAAADPAAFDEDTGEILAELGRSVGHAVSVIERRAALESDTTTELEFEATDEALSFVWLAGETGAEVSLGRAVRRPEGEFGAFYTVEGADADPDRVVDRAAAAPGAEGARVISEGEGACLVEVTTSNWFGTTFTEYGAVVRTARAGGSEGRIVVEAPQSADVRTLVESFRERYPDTELVAQRTRERAVQTLLELQDLLGEQLTPRQLEALETAYSAGYFDWPRESSGEEIAELLGVTQPTFNKHLRSAERKAFSMLLNREYPE